MTSNLDNVHRHSSPCVICLRMTEAYVTCRFTPKKFRLHMCDDCYYKEEDISILPVPFYSLFGEKAKYWDRFT